MFSPNWRKLWIGSLVLAALCGFTYGWKQRSANPPFIITRKAEEPPELKLLRKGRYDEAARATLQRAKKDLANRQRWAQQAAFYLDKATASAPKDPFVLESAMDGFNRAGDYSEEGCPHYEKAIGFGEAALALLQGSTVTVEGHVRSYPTQPIKEGIEPRLKRIRGKVEAWCRKTS